MEQYNDHCIYFCEPIKNNIMIDGIFTRILYSTRNVVFNGIYNKLNTMEDEYDNIFGDHDICEF